VLLWNARLEADKNPEEYIEVVQSLAAAGPEGEKMLFKLVVLGEDSTQDGRYRTMMEAAFGDRLLFMGFCASRLEYARWLRSADILLVTAHHETFGISVVESIYCGVFPVLPRRLSYPELLDPQAHPGCFYGKRNPAAAVLAAAMRAFSRGVAPTPTAVGTVLSWADACGALASEMRRFTWDNMMPQYEEALAGAPASAGQATGSNSGSGGDEVIAEAGGAHIVGGDAAPALAVSITPFALITQADDPRVALYRPKSLRDSAVFRVASEAHGGGEWSLHGARKATERMLRAIVAGRHIKVLSMLCTAEIAEEFRPLCREAGVGEVVVADK